MNSERKKQHRNASEYEMFLRCVLSVHRIQTVYNYVLLFSSFLVVIFARGCTVATVSSRIMRRNRWHTYEI